MNFWVFVMMVFRLTVSCCADAGRIEKAIWTEKRIKAVKNLINLKDDWLNLTRFMCNAYTFNTFFGKANASTSAESLNCRYLQRLMSYDLSSVRSTKKEY